MHKIGLKFLYEEVKYEWYTSLIDDEGNSKRKDVTVFSIDWDIYYYFE